MISTLSVLTLTLTFLPVVALAKTDEEVYAQLRHFGEKNYEYHRRTYEELNGIVLPTMSSSVEFDRYWNEERSLETVATLIALHQPARQFEGIGLARKLGLVDNDPYVRAVVRQLSESASDPKVKEAAFDAVRLVWERDPSPSRKTPIMKRQNDLTAVIQQLKSRHPAWRVEALDWLESNRMRIPLGRRFYVGNAVYAFAQQTDDLALKKRAATFIIDLNPPQLTMVRNAKEMLRSCNALVKFK